ncbi:EthD family reductase [Roseomonas sp. BN140053]|uniref:EthD family reductase n=1 Tax=Roseomonas sp. BN140053 TaxID=3391898 RepID=UPI0039E9EB95
MHKVVVLYAPPADPEHFRRHYRETHLPLAARLPGLLGSRFSFAVEGVGGPSPYFCIWEGDFADAEAMGLAMQSDIGRQVSADTANYATGGLTLLHYEVEENEPAA